MNDTNAKERAGEDLLVLTTGLFPDAATLEAAMHNDSDARPPQRYDIDLKTMDDAAWDCLLADILAARTILTL